MNKQIKNIRFFNHIKINKDETVTKLCNSNDKFYQDKFLNEINWLLKAKKIIPSYIPEIISYSLNRNNLWIKYKQIKFDTIHDLLINNQEINWSDFIKSLKKYFDLTSQIQPKIKESEEAEWNKKLNNFYFKRTIQNVNKTEKEILHSDNKTNNLFFEYDEIVINNKKYPSLKQLKKHFLNLVDKPEGIWKELCQINKSKRICFCHLDMVFSNIFFNSDNNIKLIDARGSFDDSKEYGDQLYDYAKLWQCINGLYDFIVEDKFELSIEENKIEYKILNPNLDDIKRKFLELFPKKDHQKIFLIEALQFLNMPPYHKDKPNRQTIMICIGIEHLINLIGDSWK